MSEEEYISKIKKLVADLENLRDSHLNSLRPSVMHESKASALDFVVRKLRRTFNLINNGKKTNTWSYQWNLGYECIGCSGLFDFDMTTTFTYKLKFKEVSWFGYGRVKISYYEEKYNARNREQIDKALNSKINKWLK